jgi:hypothetical protein
MRIDRRLTFIGVMLIVLSMTMATQYATTKVSYTFGIVHPSNADIRFVGSDNTSTGGNTSRVLRIIGNTSSARALVVNLGDWMPNSVHNYTAAFAVVNEESFTVNITHINISGTDANYVTIYLHKTRATDAVTDTGVLSVLGGTSQHTAANCEWQLGAGNGNPANMGGTAILTPWDGVAHVRYNDTCAQAATNGTSDYIWIQISINIPSGAAAVATATGQMWIHFVATTHS